jgi:hypothetical protein
MDNPHITITQRCEKQFSSTAVGDAVTNEFDGLFGFEYERHFRVLLLLS